MLPVTSPTSQLPNSSGIAAHQGGPTDGSAAGRAGTLTFDCETARRINLDEFAKYAHIDTVKICLPKNEQLQRFTRDILEFENRPVIQRISVQPHAAVDKRLDQTSFSCIARLALQCQTQKIEIAGATRNDGALELSKLLQKEGNQLAELKMCSSDPVTHLTKHGANYLSLAIRHPSCKLQTLNLSNNKISPESALDLIENFLDSNTLHTLRLESNDLGNAISENLIDVVKKYNETRDNNSQVTAGAPTEKKFLHLQYNKFSDDTVHELSNMCSSNLEVFVQEAGSKLAQVAHQLNSLAPYGTLLQLGAINAINGLTKR
ncbi:MAG: hypothetical protein ACK5NY_06400 [Burkholderiaceae bacterium]